jgi:hypothetical protein
VAFAIQAKALESHGSAPLYFYLKIMRKERFFMRSLGPDCHWVCSKSRVLGGLIFSVLLVVTFLLADFGIVAEATDADRYGAWYFTAGEVGAAYQYQENYGERLRNPLRAADCLFRDGEIDAQQNNRRFTVPCRFVAEITRHLKEMIEAGAAKFLFPLDADHAHLGVPLELWESKYKNLPAAEVIPAILREPRLVALYHTAEHLRITDRRTGAVDKAARSWKSKRNVLGFFDGRAIEILPPEPMGRGASMPDGYYSYGGVSFLASPRGELYLSLATKVISFDIALDSTGVEQSDDSTRPSAGPASLTRANR